MLFLLVRHIPSEFFNEHSHFNMRSIDLESFIVLAS